MASPSRWLVVFTVAALSGCGAGMTPVMKGAAVGAVAGAALGAGTGVLISDDALLGSSKQSELQLSAGASIGAGTLIGGVFGAIVGAMIGHQREAALPLPARDLAGVRPQPGSVF